MTQILAILVDSYRELNSRKLFWVTIAISGLVVISFGSIGFDEEGISLGYGLWYFESEFFNSTSPWARAFYVGLFSDFLVAIWLAWIATILALISTATIFPDFIAGGAIDLVLSKPMGRVRLFFVKYLASLLFVLAQVAVFCLGIFLCIGWRIGEWNWMIFAAIPIVTIFFSYLFSVCVLVAMISRSAITALLLTMLFWVGLWAMQSSEAILNQFRIMFEVQAEYAQIDRDATNERIAALPEITDDMTEEQIDEIESDREDLERELDVQQTRMDERLETRDKIAVWHTPIRASITILPKTQQTIGLLSRWLKDPDGISMTAILRGDMRRAGDASASAFRPPDEIETQRRMETDYDTRSPWVTIGTSLAFEMFILGIACALFVRRDF